MVKSLITIKNKSLALIWLVVLLASCMSGSVADVTVDMPANNWVYPNKVKSEIEVKDAAQRHNIYFNLRVTADYRYSNIYILFKVKDPKGREVTRRYGFKLAEADGQWLGKGSGDLYAYKLGLLTKHYFAEAGKYQLSIEQNMRDNPLTGISDAGIQVEHQVD